jgi:hypothetical protein
MRAEYLFDLARCCGIRPWETWDLTVPEFANLTDRCDDWLKTEIRMRG